MPKMTKTAGGRRLPKCDRLDGVITSYNSPKTPTSQDIAAAWISRHCRVSASTAALVAELAFSGDGRAVQ